ncbi:MAG TPA: methyltransferase domain-containing protein [Phenylobacterium sp.]|uniref:class I SAM-dependent methyltransferase n=1 Tax=Phenylobacterium sp. TaxID=1871053 RepID=UPI002B4751EF|nr:methyltransferase domain-containing protein [Phenylobacterium sp.]HKR86574.1 methyltransferase domain-containing protein [Phenylobacterium sp.]
MSEPNAAQAAYWNEAAGRSWAEFQKGLDLQVAPLGRRAMAALAPAPGERILDVGCGAGETSLELARAVGAGGAVLGVDLSEPLLDVARRRIAGVAGLKVAQGDAQVFPFEPGTFDAAFSRFGVMFFENPAAAFTNIRRALKPGGRLAFVCWRTPGVNPIMRLPMEAAGTLVPPPAPQEPGAPGPFAFADPDRVRGILADAGFEAVEITPHDEKVGSGDLETALALALRIGPLGAILRENPELREPVRPRVRATLAAHDGPEGPKLDAAVWIVTARSPA